MKLNLLHLLAIVGVAQALAYPTPQDSDFELTTDSPFTVEVEDLDLEIDVGHQLEARETAKAATDRLIFKTNISNFLKAKKAKKPASLIWKDDGCSKSPDKPLGFNFLPRCQKHDFGYRNYKKQKRMNEKNRKKIDDHFKKELYSYCNSFSGLQAPLGPPCRRLADLYYAGVRKAGDGRVFNIKI